MGLDMGLSKRPKFSEEIVYWRKANQIREWFVKRLGDKFVDNGETKVEREDLEALVADCKKVLANHELAEDILPTSVGFFFGSQAYDEWYFSDLEDTVKMVTEAIETTDWDKEEVSYWEWY